MKRKNLGFDIFIYAIGIVLGSTTMLFGYNYLTIAGTDVIGRFVGALYALLLADIAFWVWRSALGNNDLTTKQRQWAGLLTVCGFALSLAFTLGQLSLTTNLKEYVDITAIDEGVYWVLIVATAVNALGVWRFQNNSIDNIIRDKVSETKADLTDTVLAEAKLRVDRDADAIVNAMSEQVRTQILQELGFNPDLTLTGKKLIPDSRQNVPHQNGASVESA